MKVQMCRKADVIRLLTEYLKKHAGDKHARTVLRAIRHDVKHNLQNTGLSGSTPSAAAIRSHQED